MLAKKANVPVLDVADMAIWGNHSTTQVPDYLNAKIGKKPLMEVIKDLNWLQNDFIQSVRNRGASVIKLRGKSSAASATQAIIDAIKDLVLPLEGKWFSSAICSDNNPYGIKADLIFSFPCAYKNGKLEIVKNLHLDNFLLENIKLSEKELMEEKDQIRHLLK
jgi:malate/lactate dehydrogenase